MQTVQTFDVGDKVRVVHWGKRYDLASSTALDMELPNWVVSSPRDERPELVWTIVAKRPTGTGHMYGVTCINSTNSHIFMPEALVLVCYGRKFSIGDTVRVTNIGSRYTDYTEMAEAMGLNLEVYRKSCTLLTFSASDRFTVVSIRRHTIDKNVILCGIFCKETGSVFIINELGLDKVGEPVELIQKSKLCEVQWRSKLVLNLPKVTHTFRLKFPNGEEVETPKPPETEWFPALLYEHNWPARHIEDGPDAYSLDASIVHEAGQCWWHDFKKRAEVEKAQILQMTTWNRTEQPKKEPESYPQVYEWL